MTEVGDRPPQIIPRPPSSEPGPPAPWERLGPDQRRGFTLALVRARLDEQVDIRVRPVVARESAVLAALFEEAGESRVVLTRRAATLRSHRGEVSFPGGRVEPGETLVETALRESWEEVHLDGTGIEIIATLTPLETFSSQALIRPFVGALPGRPQLRANPVEVARVFDVSLAELLVAGVHRSERWGIGDVSREMHFFELPGDIVWGATARLLWELLARVTSTLAGPGLDSGPVP
ncbi:MAG: NUDIX hydrolase [Acidimicrobiales bacterium]